LGDKRSIEPLLATRWLESDDFTLKIAISWALNQLGFINPQPRR
jgi:hypothetical protein